MVYDDNPIFSALPKLAAALDLSLLSHCNHTIISHGTYSYWAGFLSGKGRGKRILPNFFPKYRAPNHYSFDLYSSPLESKLPRFYYGMRGYR